MEIQVLDNDGPEYKNLHPASAPSASMTSSPPSTARAKPISKATRRNGASAARHRHRTWNGKEKIVDAAVDDAKRPPPSSKSASAPPKRGPATWLPLGGSGTCRGFPEPPGEEAQTRGHHCRRQRRRLPAAPARRPRRRHFPWAFFRSSGVASTRVTQPLQTTSRPIRTSGFSGELQLPRTLGKPHGLVRRHAATDRHSQRAHLGSSRPPRRRSSHWQSRALWTRPIPASPWRSRRLILIGRRRSDSGPEGQRQRAVAPQRRGAWHGSGGT